MMRVRAVEWTRYASSKRETGTFAGTAVSPVYQSEANWSRHTILYNITCIQLHTVTLILYTYYTIIIVCVYLN